MLERIFGISSALAENTTNAAGTAATQTDAGSTLLSYLITFAPMILIFVVFYFFLIRPQKKKDKQVKDMLNALKVGDRICTIGGIYGTIISLRDDTVELAVGHQDTPMVLARWAIRSVEAVSIENDAETLN